MSDDSVKEEPAERRVNKRAFGQRLRELRTEKGITQAKLAEMAGVKQSSIADYEKGRSLPKYMTLTRISDALDVPLMGEFLNWDEGQGPLQHSHDQGVPIEDASEDLAEWKDSAALDEEFKIFADEFYDVLIAEIVENSGGKLSKDVFTHAAYFLRFWWSHILILPETMPWPQKISIVTRQMRFLAQETRARDLKGGNAE